MLTRDLRNGAVLESASPRDSVAGYMQSRGCRMVKIERAPPWRQPPA